MTQTSAIIQWKAPDSNGSPIISYKVMITIEGDPNNSFALIVDGNSSDCQVELVILVHRHKVTKLNPLAKYIVSVCACNSLGEGAQSEVIRFCTENAFAIPS